MSDAIWSSISKLGEQIAGERVKRGYTENALSKVTTRVDRIEISQRKMEDRWALIKWWTAAIIGILGTVVQFRAFLMSDSATKMFEVLGDVLKVLGT